MNKKELFLNTLSGAVYNKKPVWFMRQAGRFLKSYRKLREQYDFLTMCTTPELASKVTIMPLHEIDVDAMILFSDILIPLLALGAKLTYKDGVSPFVENLDLDNLSYDSDNIESVMFVADTIEIIKNNIKDAPLIGFSAAPFTLGCYLFGAGGDFYKIRSFIYKNPLKYTAIMNVLTDLTIDYLNLQIAAGVDAVQVFDSWGGIVPKSVYKDFIFPFNQNIAKSLNIPSIYYIKNSAYIKNEITNLDFDCLSVDWREDIREIHKASSKCVQGNLDNTLLLSSQDALLKAAEQLLASTKDIPHIFNLGHGVLPQTSEDMVKILVETIHG